MLNYLVNYPGNEYQTPQMRTPPPGKKFQGVTIQRAVTYVCSSIANVFIMIFMGPIGLVFSIVVGK